MPRLNGQEASALAYLAEHPNASYKDEVINSLRGTARIVAKLLVGKDVPEASEGDKAAAKAVKRWAERKNKL